MSNNDSFIDEVTEEVRRDRLFALMRKYGWVGILAILAIVGGTAWNEWSKRSAEERARSYGDALAAAIGLTDPAARAAALDAVAADAAQAGLLRLIVSADALARNDKARALDALEALAETQEAPQLYRDLAQLKRVMIAGPDMDAAERDALLQTLATPGAPFRPLAMEQQALALVDAGKTDEALAALGRILEESTLTPGLRRRAAQLIVALGGDPAPPG
ncbi:MAG: tetratricopeptide repeat protein [Paracoccaceae bacterium]